MHESQFGQIDYEKMNLFEILAFLFTEKVLRELSRGVLRTYITQIDELNTVRGRIDTTLQMRRDHLKSTTVSCIYDEFHSNHAINRIFKATLRRIMNHSKQMNTRKRASHAIIYLDEAADSIDQRILRKAIYFDRSNRRYEECYRLAMLLLSQSAPTPQKGNKTSSSILFKMNDLFESYIAYLVQKITSHVVVKDRSYKLLIKESNDRSVFQLEPDLLIQGSNGQSMIIDTKWKIIDSSYRRHGVKREDFYQMYAYLTRYKSVGTVILLYPYHDEIDRSDGVPLESWYVEGQPDKRLLVHSINYEDERLALQELKSILKS
ncbi:hypothetical protein RE628_07635 [Paenibacillus sp. D2_2]|nr:hypothetical protein [Paenibacillus sp. D2_2]WMT43442.1 hypothetical protein RE628_07635 [Paenibacillus sp. D2_2]